MKKLTGDMRITPRFATVFFTIFIFALLDLYILLTNTPPLNSLAGKLFAHLLLCLGFLITLFYFHKEQIDMRFLLPFGIFTITLGAPGALTILFSMLLYLLYIKFTPAISDLMSMLLPPMEQDASDIIYERIIYRLDDFHPDRVPIPFKDIMAFGSYKQKRMTIEKILRYYRPEFASALKSGLEDKSSAVKVQAATALNYIDHKLFEENFNLKTLCNEDSSDLDALKAYALHTQNYVNAEILDSDRRERMIQSGVEAFEAYLKKLPDDLDMMLNYAELLYTQKNHLKSKAILNTLLEREFSSKAALLKMKVLYMLKEFEELRQFSHVVKEKIGKRPLHDELFSSVKFWTLGLQPGTLNG